MHPCDGGIPDGNSTGLYTKDEEVPEVIVDFDVGAQSGLKEFGVECIFDGGQKVAYVWDGMADVLPFC